MIIINVIIIFMSVNLKYMQNRKKFPKEVPNYRLNAPFIELNRVMTRITRSLLLFSTSPHPARQLVESRILSFFSFNSVSLSFLLYSPLIYGWINWRFFPISWIVSFVLLFVDIIWGNYRFLNVFTSQSPGIHCGNIYRIIRINIALSNADGLKNTMKQEL